MKKRNVYRNKLRWKLLLLFGAILLLIAAIFLRQREREKAKAEYEASIKQEREGKNQEEEWKGEFGEEQETEDRFLDTEETTGLQDEKGEETVTVHIRNLEEYAADLMGDDTGLLEESLGNWVVEKHLDAESAAILNVMIPENDPQSIHFYIRMDDGEGSLVLLSYQPGEKVVTASDCDYTEEEILAEAWEGNGPGQRDVTVEEDTEFLNNQEGMNDTEGED